MNSRLYVGQLMHRRTQPVLNRFRYGVFYCYLDLDELSTLDRRLKLFSYNQGNLVSFQDRDHMGRDSGGTRVAVSRWLDRLGINLDGGSVGLLTSARILNYVFNPVSFYLCRERSGALRTVLAEVHNTQGGEHVYPLALEPVGDRIRHRARADKAFHVSPFIETAGHYEFEFECPPGGPHSIRIDEYQHGECFFEAALDVRPLPLTDANLARLLLRYPFMTAQTIALIHWQALRLWRQGLPYRPNPQHLRVKA